MERRIEKRGDRLYVDTGQTGRSRTIVAPYSVRAISGARVSTPLFWDEVHLALDPSVYTIHSVVERFETHGDPMAGLLEERPNLTLVLAELSRWTQAL
jgi:bifunctional non-homologous end joining protein LigD